MNYKNKIIIAGFALLTTIAAANIVKALPNVSVTQASTTPVSLSVKDIQRFANVVAQIKQYYVESISDKKLFDYAIEGMLNQLDPHSSYLNADDMKDIQTIASGKFGGIGIEIMPEDGFIKVISPLDDTPAYKAGIKAGDVIIRINNKLVKNMSVRQAIDEMRGKKGSIVKITLIRKSEKKPINLSVTRDIINIQSVKSRLLEPGYGYVRIAFFQGPALKDLTAAVEQLKAQSNGQLKGLVLDLRNNPGGLLDSAIQVSDAFLDAQKLKNNKLIVYTKGRIKQADVKADATGTDIIPGVPIIVLINGGSASAAEIVAGALQDHRRAIILGTRSFGKGSVQTVIPIDESTGIKLTTALYYTPAGHSIQAKGIEPDVMIADLKIPKENGDSIVIDPIVEADLPKHLNNGNEKKETLADQQPTQPEEKEQTTENELVRTDFQLYSALNLLKGLSVKQNLK